MIMLLFPPFPSDLTYPFLVILGSIFSCAAFLAQQPDQSIAGLCRLPFQNQRAAVIILGHWCDIILKKKNDFFILVNFFYYEKKLKFFILFTNTRAAVIILGHWSILYFIFFCTKIYPIFFYT